MNSVTERIKRLQDHLSSQYVDFDQEVTTDRLNSLYSDFSKLKLLNPYGYEANVNYWRAVILDCNLQGYLTTKDHICYIDKNELPELFYRPKKGKPLSLDNVIQEMIEKTHDLLTQKEFEKKYPIQATAPHSTQLSWFQWFYYTPYRWLIPEAPPQQYIVLPTVQEYAKIIHQKHYKQPLCSVLDSLFTFQEFKEAYGTISCYQETIIQLTDMDLWLVLRYLHHHYGVDIADTDKGIVSKTTVIKFPEHHEAEKVLAKITNNDKSIINLKTACTKLHEQVNGLQTKSEEFLESAKEHLKNKRKPQAVYMYKKNKQIEEILNRRLKTLETMETILLKIEAAQNDLQVVQAFNMGADALRSILNTKELKIDNIDKTIENIQESLDDQKEIEEAMMNAHEDISNQQFNQEELEDELNALKQEQESPAPEKKPVVHLTQPIDTESELLRLQTVFSSLKPSKPRVKELA